MIVNINFVHFLSRMWLDVCFEKVTILACGDSFFFLPPALFVAKGKERCVILSHYFCRFQKESEIGRINCNERNNSEINFEFIIKAVKELFNCGGCKLWKYYG